MNTNYNPSNPNANLNPSDDTHRLAMVTPEEFNDGPDADDLAEPNYDGPLDEGHIYHDEDAFKMDTYEDKMRFLQSIHDEIDWKIAARENLLKI